MTSNINTIIGTNRIYIHQVLLKDYHSFWSTCLDFNHVLVRVCICFSGCKSVTMGGLCRAQFRNEKVKNEFREELVEGLIKNVRPEEAWNDI